MDKLTFSNEYFYDEVRDGFYISEMMKRYWAAQLEVLKVIDDICEKHGLKWFAIYGTMLGAVRHKGYIPWDDDLDICMLRSDYDKFFSLAEKELPEGYCILTAEREKEYIYPFGRITNSHAIDLNQEFLKKYHGCPYVVGVDIYPYDKMFADEKLEEKRDKRGFELLKTRPLSNEQCLEVNRICTEAENTDSEEYSLLYSWILYRGYRFPASMFKEFTELVFENTTVPVPTGYHEMLTKFYSDYMKKVIPGGEHDYPVFKELEVILREHLGKNPYRYTMRTNALPPLRPRAATDDRGKDILFLPCRAAWWDTMKPVFEGALADSRNTVSIVPIPHFDCDYLGNIGEVHMNSDDFAGMTELAPYLTSFEQYGLGTRRPDVIVIQVPYDAHSCALTVPEILYSDNLVRFTDELAYVPCFDTLVPDTDDSKIAAALQYLIEQPALVNADRIILKHERIKEVYLNSLVALTSPGHRDYWKRKLCLLSETEWIKES